MTTIPGFVPHLQDRYGIRVEALTELEPGGGVFRVDRGDGAPWVARAFPPARAVEAAAGDAAILSFLEAHGFPAERPAADAPVSAIDGRGVLVTTFVPGRHLRGDGSADTMRLIGDLVGRLHALPPGSGPVVRSAGGWHHLSVNGGGRTADVEALLPLMDGVAAERVPPAERSLYDDLVAELRSLGDHPDLPQALIHPDLCGPNVIAAPDGGVAVIDWTGTGRGARIASLPALMTADDPRSVDAFMEGYGAHARLEPEEVDRLAAELCVFPLLLDCWMFVFHAKPVSAIVRGRSTVRERADAVAARVRDVRGGSSA